MRRATSAIRTSIRRLTLSLAVLAGHTVRIANRVGTVLLALAGFSLVSWGVAMYSTPAGWITGGVSLLVVAYDANRLPATPKRSDGGD
jgi:hypothetical protein